MITTSQVLNRYMEAMLQDLWQLTGERHSLDVKLPEEAYFEYWTQLPDSVRGKDFFPAEKITMFYSSGKVVYTAGAK